MTFIPFSLILHFALITPSIAEESTPDQEKSEDSAESGSTTTTDKSEDRKESTEAAPESEVSTDKTEPVDDESPPKPDANPETGEQSEMAASQQDIAEFRDTIGRFSKRMYEFESESKSIVSIQKEEELRALDEVYGAIVNELERDEVELTRTTIGRFEDFLRKYPTEDRSASIMFRLGNLYVEEEQNRFSELFILSLEQDEDPIEELKQDFVEPITLFQDIIDKFPDSGYKDGALYMYGWCHQQKDSAQYEVDTFIEAYENLVSEYPDSPYAPQSNFYLAMEYFNKNEMNTAIKHYENAMLGAEEGEILYEFSLYGLAWSYYRQDDFANSLKLMTDVLDYSERLKKRTGSEALVAEEAITYSAFSFADIADREGKSALEVASTFYSSVGERPYEARVFKDLAKQLEELQRVIETIEVYEYIQDRWPADPENPVYQYRIAELYSFVGDEEAVSEAMATLTERYDDDSDWWRLNRNNPDAQDIAQRYIEESLISVADNQLNKAVDVYGTGDILSAQGEFAKAADLYGRYLSKFPFAGDYYRNQWLMSISLNQSRQFREALIQFDQLIDSATDHNYKETAAFRKLLVYQELVKDLHGNEFSVLPESSDLETKRMMPSGQELPTYKLQEDHVNLIDAYEKAIVLDYDSRLSLVTGQISDLNIELEAAEKKEDKAALEQKIGELTQLETDVKTYKQSLSAVRFQFEYIIGQIMFSHGRYDDARTWFNLVIDSKPQSKEAEYAASTIIRTYQDEENWEMVQQSSARFIAMQLGPEGGVSDFALYEQEANLRLAELIEKTAKSLLEEGKFDEATVQFNLAGRAYESFLTDYPDAPDIKSALLLAAYSYQSGGNTIRANQLFQRFVDDYPADPSSRSLLFTIAMNYQNSLDYQNAINYFEILYNQTYGKRPIIVYPDAINAYYNTALLKVGLGDFKGAAQRFEEYAKKHKDLPNAEASMYYAGEYWEKVGIWPGIEFYERYLRKYEGENEDRTIEAKYRLLTLLEKGRASNTKITKLWDEIWEAYEASAPSGSVSPILKRYATLYQLRSFDETLAPLETLKYVENVSPATDEKNAEVIKTALELRDEISEYCVPLQEIGDLNALMASYYCLAYTDNFIGRLLGGYPIPDFLPYEVQDIYIENLDQQKAPLLESGKTGFIQVLEVSNRTGAWLDWSDMALIELSKLDGKAYPPPKDDIRGNVTSDFTPTLGPISPKLEGNSSEEQKSEKRESSSEGGEAIESDSIDTQNESAPDNTESSEPTNEVEDEDTTEESEETPATEEGPSPWGEQ